MSNNCETDYAQLIEIVDSEIECLKKDATQFSKILFSLENELENFVAIVSSEYKELLKNISLKKQQSVKQKLESIRSSVNEKRIQVHQSVLKEILSRARKKINSPFWLGESSNANEVIEKNQRRLDSFRNDQMHTSIVDLKAMIDEMLLLEKRICNDEKKSQFRFPLKVLLWSLPIVIGVWISDKLSSIGNLIVASILIVIVFLSYIFIKFSLHEKILSLRFIPKRFEKNDFFRIVLMMTTMLAVFSSIGAKKLDDYIIRNRLDYAHIIPTEKIVRGNDFIYKYRIGYRYDKPAVDVNLSMEAPGIKQDFDTIHYNALAGEKIDRKAIRISVPDDIPKGVYFLKIRISYTAQRSFPFPFVKNNKRYYFREELEIVVL